jgi:hypothetical protein
MKRIYLRYSCISGKIIFLMGVFLLINGCATKIALNMLQPAEYHEASLTKTVAVTPSSWLRMIRYLLIRMIQFRAGG